MLSVPARSKKTLITSTIAALALVVLALFGAASAHAQADGFGAGDGHDGAATFPAGTHVPNAVAPVSGAVAAGAGSVTITAATAGSGSNAVGFAANRLVLIYQSNGVATTPTSGSQTAYPLSNTTAGHWEFARISTATATTLTFTRPLIYSYAAGTTQAIAVPEYSSLTTSAAGATINPQTWNGTTGGVLAILVNGTVNLTAGGTISASGFGFRGGVSSVNNPSEAHNCGAGNDSTGADGFGAKGEGFYLAAFAPTATATNAQRGRGNQLNAGGGGNCFNAGGGGGGGVGQGGAGGNSLNEAPGSNQVVGGLGGAAVTRNAYQHLPMGGGGGQGDRDDANVAPGGRGGGVVLVRGLTLTGTGTFSANGAAGGNGNQSSPNDGAGGGGAGGSVMLRFVNAAACTGATATGGTGGNNGSSGGNNWTPGGGGGGGAVFVQSASGTCTSTVTGGARGTGGSNNGASAGGNGAATTATTLAVTLSAPTNGTTYSTLPANITGTATSGSTVNIYIDEALVGTTVATGGNWTLATPALTQGLHTVRVFSESGSAQSGQVSATFTYDNVAPAAPVITAPAAATTYTTDTTPTVTGTAEANSTVNVYRGGSTLIGTTTANGSGDWTLDTSTLADGSYTVTARATDGANNQGVASASKTIVVDTTAPTVNLTVPANGSATNDTTPQVTFGLTEANPGTSRCIINGVLPGTVCNSGDSLAALAPGSYTLTIQHTDLAGNVGTSTTAAFTVDTTVPVAPSIGTPATNITTNDTTPTIGGTAEIGSTVRVYDGAGTGTQVGTAVITNGSGAWVLSPDPTLSSGVHNLHAVSTDAAGNVSADSNIRTITIDTTAPTATITSPATNGSTIGPNGNFTFTTSDAIGPVTTTCQIDSGTAVSCTSPFAYSGLTNGAHSFTVVATDAAGNNSVSAVRTFTVDATPPNTTITGQPAAVTNATTAAFTFTSTESPATFECVLDSDPLASCTSGISYSSLGQGSHTFQVRAIDQYGNFDLSPASYTWTVDTTAPVAPTISTPGSDIVTADTTPAIGGLSEPNSTVRVYEGVTLIGTATANGSGDWSLSPDPTLSAGVSHTLVARATDGAGNVSPDSSPRVITIDTAAPTVTITAPTNGSTVATTQPAFTFNVVDANPSATSLCIIDGAPGVTCTSGFTPSALGQGPHTLQVQHTDIVGNVGSSAIVNFTVDTLAPDAPVITGGPSAPVASTTAAFTFTGEVGATYECFIDSPVAWTSCTSGVTYTSLAQGAHTFHVRQYDTAGNVSSESTRSWTVDTVGPPAPSVSGPSGTVGTTSATINFNDLESPVTYRCSLDGAVATVCTDPATVSGLSDGPHSYAVYAVDPLGNAGATTTINWTVDSSLFTAGITAGPLGTVSTNNNSLSFTATILPGTTFMCRVDAAAFAACTSPISTGVLADGSHTFDVYAVNGSQNSPTVSRTWTIDTVGPNLSISAPTNGQTVGPNGNVVFSATDSSGPITYTCQIDSGTATSCGSPFVFTGLSDGPHSVTVVATDGVSNSSSVVRNFNVDANPPNTTITANPALITNSTSASFSFTSSEGSSTFECSLDGAPIASCTSPRAYAGPLSQSSHTFSVRAIDQYGNVDQTPATYTWTVDTTAPIAPSINTPGSDVVTADTTPAIAGLAEPNATVRVYEGVTLIGTATANGSGDWSLSPNPTFSAGPHALVARATDEAGNTSVDSTTRTITIDTTSPAVDITGPAHGSSVNTDSPDVIFTATDTNLTTVQCSIDGSTAVACTSPWPTSGLSEGLHNVSVLATDAAGAQTVVTNTFTVDLTDPVAPTITSPATDITTIDTTPTISGSSEADAIIKIYDDGVEVDEVTADGSGNWSWTSPTPVSEEAHPYTVTATDAAGNVSAESSTRTITVDLTTPDAPIITNPASDAVTSSVRPQISGTSEPNALITVYDDLTMIGTATANGSGDWTFTPTSDLDEGEHSFTATQTDAADHTSVQSSARVITIDLTAPDAPEITTPAQDLTTAVNTQPVSGTAEPGSTVTVYDGATLIATVTADGSGNWSLSPDPTFTEGSHALTAWSADEAGNISDASEIVTITVDNTDPLPPVILSPTDNSDLEDTTPTITGNGESGTSIDVYDGATLICSATVDNVGVWSCTPTTPLSEGDHTLTATSTDVSGNESDPSAEIDVTIDTTGPSVLISSPTAAATVATHTPGISFTATDDNLDEVQCRVDTDLTWVDCTSPWTTPSLPDGAHVVEVRATDTAGNSGTASVAFIVDTTAPVTSIVDTPDALDNDPTPTFTFTVTGGPATAECRIVPAAFAPCSSPYTSAALSHGEHTFEVRSTDSHGNIESPAQSFTWTVDIEAPDKPVVTAPSANSTTGDDTPTISGTAEANSSVGVFVDGNSIGTVTANGSGQWTIPAPHLSDGLHNASAVATDQAGNTGAAANSVIFTVDTTPPDGTVTAQTGTGGGTAPPTYNIQTPDGTATITCSVDGASASPCASPFTPSGPFTPGTHTLVVTFTDPSGNSTTRTITFTIAAPTNNVTPPPPPAATDSDPLPAACFAKGIAISNIAVVGGKVKVSGFARLSYVGKTVTLTYKPTGVKALATATVGVDGSFTVSTKAPPSNLRMSNKTLYRATVADESTPWTKLARRVASSTATYKNGKLVVSGLLSKPLMPKAKVTIAARTGCDGPWVTVTKGAVKSNGAFSTSTAYKVSTGVVFVRVAAVVSKGGSKPKALRTYSFVMPVVLR